MPQEEIARAVVEERGAVHGAEGMQCYWRMEWRQDGVVPVAQLVR